MNIGQKVRIKNHDDLPEDLRTQKTRGVAGLEAEIIDCLRSEAERITRYKLRLTGAKTVPLMLFTEEALELVEDEEPADYYHEIDYLDNLVLVRFYKEQNGKKVEVARSHGHIIHAGAQGIAQATSYAMRRLWEQLKG